MTSKQQYHKLSPSTEDADDQVLESGSANKRKWTRWVVILAFVGGALFGVGSTFALSAIIEATSYAAQMSPPKAIALETSNDHDVNEYYGLVVKPSAHDPICGIDRHEAKRNGCKYDLMASRWYPEECFHGDVLRQMLKEVDFDWYWDPEHTQLATWDTALAGDYDMLYPLYDFHIIHCLYQFRRLHMAVIEHRQIDDDVYSYGHTMHCTKLIMQWPLEWKYGKNTTTVSPSGISYCIPPFL